MSSWFFSSKKKSIGNGSADGGHPPMKAQVLPDDPAQSESMDDYYDDESTFDGDRSLTHNRSSVTGGDSGHGGSSKKSAERLSRFHDEPEVDYDENPTPLYKLIENKDWDGALSRIDREKWAYEARTWVSRREASNDRKVRWRLLPIHATCVFRSPLSLIERLIEANPDGSQMKDDQGMLPIHLACRNGASKGVVVTLLNSFPESLNVKDRKGRVPMALVENSTSQNREAVIVAMKKFANEVRSREEKENAKKMAKSAPKVVPHGHGMVPVAGANGSIEVTRNASHVSAFVPRQGESEVDYEHRTVLFRLVLKKDWEAATNRSSERPDEASTWIVTKGFNGNLRFLPIHKACVLQPPASAVEALVGAHPDGASSKDQDGWLPLHCACFYGASEAVVSALLVAHPKAAQNKDDEGRLPLHYSCLKTAPADVVTALLRSFPKAAMSKDDEGRLPIHHACSKGAGGDVVEALLRASPRGAQSKDDQGRLPLHHACRKGASERVIATLLRVYPRGAQAKDDQDKLPLHYACQAGADEGVVQSLLAAYPDGVDVKNGFGYTPLAEARAMGDNPKMVGVVRVLEGFKAEQNKVRERQNAMGGGGAAPGEAETGAARSGGGGVISQQQAADLERQVSQLTKKVEALEVVLAGVGTMGAEMKKALNDSESTTDFQVAVGNFADQLASLGGGSRGAGGANEQSSSSSKSPSSSSSVKPGE